MKEKINWKSKALVASILTLPMFMNYAVMAKEINTGVIANILSPSAVQTLSNITCVEGNGKIKVENGKLSLTDVGGKSLFMDQNSSVFDNSEAELSFNIERDGAEVGVFFRFENTNKYVAVTVQTGGGGGHVPGAVWRLKVPGQQDVKLFADFSKIHGGRKAPCLVKVRLEGKHLTIYFDGAMMYEGTHDHIPLTSGKNGFIFQRSNAIVNHFITAPSLEMKKSEIAFSQAKTLKNKMLTVRMDGTFPRVIDYTLTQNASLLGQPEAYNYVDINGTLYNPKVTCKQTTATSIVYHVKATKDLFFDVRYFLENHVLNVKIENYGKAVKSINFPNNHLVSMDITSPEAKYSATNMGGQQIVDLAKQGISKVMQYTRIPVLSNNSIAATMTNNSFKYAFPVAYEIYQTADGKKYAGLNSNEYVLQYALDEILGVQSGNDTARVAVVGDYNGDKKVDVQDGLIAYRDDIQFKHMDNDLVKNNSFSIAMIVGSIAQYPFLRILDNVKKVAMLTDNFGQAIIIKGYQDEGHDASHPDYANYNERAGGLKDFKTLLEEAPKFGGNMGIHINHSEVYPEAKQFNAIKTQSGAWSWYDSAMVLDRANDILDTSSNGMAGRLEQLAKDTLLKDGKTPGIKLVYVDTYFEKRWASKKLADKLNELGWPMGTENLPNFPGRSMFSHHGEGAGYTQLIRYVHNSDIAFVIGGTPFRGTTDGGYAYRSGINGWQQSFNLNAAMEEFYKNVLPGKYLQYFPIMEWDKFGDQAKLGKNKEVETIGKGDKQIIKKDGKIILQGNKIFIPWDPIKETKIYHYNLNGGSTTWNLPNSWKNVKEVYLYTLTDIGRREETKIPVVNGSITLNVKAKIPYIIYKTAQKMQTAESVKWGEGTFIKDGGFDSRTWGYGWKKYSSANTTEHIVYTNTDRGNTIVKVNGKNDAKIVQKITGLTGGKKYSASVWVLISEGHHRKTTVTVKAGEQKISNYMDVSDFKYGHTHNDKLNTKWQRIDVDFVQPVGKTTAELIFDVAASTEEKSSVSFDNARVVQIDWTDKGTHYFYEDFESFREAFGPFVSDNTDNSHLSEKIPEATSVKDVIAGQFSFKIRAGNYMRTLPHTLRFLPGHTYRVSIASKNENDNATKEGVFIFAAKTKAGNKTLATQPSVANEKGKVGVTTLIFSTENFSDVYIDITAGKDKNYILDNLIVDDITDQK